MSVPKSDAERQRSGLSAEVEDQCAWLGRISVKSFMISAFEAASARFERLGSPPNLVAAESGRCRSTTAVHGQKCRRAGGNTHLSLQVPRLPGTLSPNSTRKMGFLVWVGHGGPCWVHGACFARLSCRGKSSAEALQSDWHPLAAGNDSSWLIQANTVLFEVGEVVEYSRRNQQQTIESVK